MRGDFRRVLCLIAASWAVCAAAPLRGARGAALLEAGAAAGTRELPCLNNCAGPLGKRGTCVKGVCVCDEGFSGPDCSLTDKPGLPGDAGLLANRTKPFFTSDTEAPTDGATCTDSLCESVCTYGGVCKDARTCLCRLDRGNETSAQLTRAAGTDRSPREPIPAEDHEFQALMDVFDSLGAPVAPGNPCTHWRQWPSVRCSVDGHIIGVDLGRRKLTGTFVPSGGAQSLPRPARRHPAPPRAAAFPPRSESSGSCATSCSTTTGSAAPCRKSCSSSPSWKTSSCTATACRVPFRRAWARRSSCAPLWPTGTSSRVAFPGRWASPSSFATCACPRNGACRSFPPPSKPPRPAPPLTGARQGLVLQRARGPRPSRLGLPPRRRDPLPQQQQALRRHPQGPRPHDQPQVPAPGEQ